jgi:hypothetical protein
MLISANEESGASDLGIKLDARRRDCFSLANEFPQLACSPESFN